MCSLFLWYIIYRYISEKPVVLINLVDLLYQDTIIYIYLLSLIFSVALAHTIFVDNENFKMTYELALIYSIFINFFCNNLYACLTVAASLRLISILKNSESAGLQLFGPDKDALFVIRVSSNILSMLFPCYLVTRLRTYPAMFGLFNGGKSISDYESIKNNKFASLLLVFPIITLLVNLTVQVCSIRIRKQLYHAAQIFVIFNADNESKNSDTFSLSISHVLVIPVLILMTFFQSFADRKQRLFFLSPFHLFLLSVALPLFILFKSPKIQKFFRKKFTAQFTKTLIIYQKMFMKCFFAKIVPIDNPPEIVNPPICKI